MKSLDILADLLVPPTPARVAAIDSGLLALTENHVDPATATALMQHLCANAPSASPYTEAGEEIFKRLLQLGGNPWGRTLQKLQDAATLALRKSWSGPVVQSLALPHPSLPEQIIAGEGPQPQSWLRIAVRRGMQEVVKALLEAGADPNEAPGTAQPLLHVAPTHAQIISLLLEHGADPCVRDRDGKLCVHAWSRDYLPEFVHALACVMDRGPGLDRFSLLRLVGGRPGACKPLLEGVTSPRDLVDDQGRSIFFHMAAALLEHRGGAGGASRCTNKQLMDRVKATLAWRNAASSRNELDAGATRLLLWSARVLSTQMLAKDTASDLAKLEQDCGLTGQDRADMHQSALASLDEMVAAGLLHDPSEVAASAFAGYWDAADKDERTLVALDPDGPVVAWMDRCFRGIHGGPWSQGQSESNRWASPDVPIEGFRKNFLEIASKAPMDHPLWSTPATARVLVQLLRGDWKSDKGYYRLELGPLDEDWSARLRNTHAPLMARMGPQALCEALTDPCTRATVMAMEGKNCHIQSLVAQVENDALDAATPAVAARTRSGPRL